MYKMTDCEPTDHDMKQSAILDSFYVLLCIMRACDRAMTHGVILYDILTNFEFLVSSSDNRRYDDLDGSLTKEEVIRDARFVDNYLKSLNGKNELIA